MPKNLTNAKKQTVYAEGRKAFEDGKSRQVNPYIGTNEQLVNIWWYGWDAAKRDSIPPDTEDDPDKTIPRPR